MTTVSAAFISEAKIDLNKLPENDLVIYGDGQKLVIRGFRGMNIPWPVDTGLILKDARRKLARIFQACVDKARVDKNQPPPNLVPPDQDFRGYDDDDEDEDEEHIPRQKVRTFTLTTNHIKLLREMHVGWQDCETGAPEIDPKRPYGNSYVPGDVARILTGHRPGPNDEPLTEDEEHHYILLHNETKTALQIVLSTGTFEPGKYVCEDYGRKWKKSD